MMAFSASQRELFEAGNRPLDVVDSSSVSVSRMVNLTLAPDIVAAVLNETLPAEVTWFDLAAEPPGLWADRAFAYIGYVDLPTPVWPKVARRLLIDR